MFPFKQDEETALIKELGHREVAVPLPETHLRTVRPTDVPDSVKEAVGQPQSRTNVINIIDGNVEHEIESIDFELVALAKRQEYLMKLRRKYLKVLQAISDDE